MREPTPWRSWRPMRKEQAKDGGAPHAPIRGFLRPKRSQPVHKPRIPPPTLDATSNNGPNGLSRSNSERTQGCPRDPRDFQRRSRPGSIPSRSTPSRTRRKAQALAYGRGRSDTIAWVRHTDLRRHPCAWGASDSRGVTGADGRPAVPDLRPDARLACSRPRGGPREHRLARRPTPWTDAPASSGTPSPSPESRPRSNLPGRSPGSWTRGGEERGHPLFLAATRHGGPRHGAGIVSLALPAIIVALPIRLGLRPPAIFVGTAIVIVERGGAPDRIEDGDP